MAAAHPCACVVDIAQKRWVRPLLHHARRAGLPCPVSLLGLCGRNDLYQGTQEADYIACPFVFFVCKWSQSAMGICRQDDELDCHKRRRPDAATQSVG
jgi:hypothetical protein